MDMQLWITNQSQRLAPQFINSQMGSPSLLVSNSLDMVAKKYAPISLQEMNDDVSLLNRVDKKFVMTKKQLNVVLENLHNDYQILTIQKHRLNHYHTVYFDTPDFQLYHMHVNENAERYKIRYREYLDSCVSYLEVKHKTRKERTIKDRIPALLPYAHTVPEANAWLSEVCPYDPEWLEPKMSNAFTRITLVNKKLAERVTLDTNLVFFSRNNLVRMEEIAIAEVKTSNAHQLTPFIMEMRKMRIQPQGFSKYCMGISMLYDNVKKNAIKPKMLMIKKMLEGDY